MNQITYLDMLESVFRASMISIIGAPKTTPSAALDATLSIPPANPIVKSRGFLSAARL